MRPHLSSFELDIENGGRVRILCLKSVAKTLRCTVNCTVESEEHVAHVQHVEQSPAAESAWVSVSYNVFK